MLLLALLAAATEAAPSSGNFSVKDWGFIGVLVAQGIAMLIFLQKGREAMAKEVAMVLDAKKEAAPMRVQDPLNVRAHVDYTPLADHKELVDEVKELRSSMTDLFKESSISAAKARKELHEKITEQAVHGAGMAAEVKLVTARVVQMDGKIDMLLSRSANAQPTTASR